MKKYFITGLVLLLPMALTLMVILFFFNLFAIPFAHFASLFLIKMSDYLLFIPSPKLLFIASRIFAVLFLFLFLCLLGAVARRFFFKSLIKWTHRLMSKIPLLKTIYKISHDVIDAILSMDGKKAFKAPVMTPFPAAPSFALGFEAGELAREIEEKLNTKVIPVFSPTAPHPISGFLFFVPEKDVHRLSMDNEDAFKFLLSCGLIHPTEIK
jgi:uncharacterized membrane protein